MQLTETRLNAVVAAAEANLRRGLDLIAIHSEQSVRGPEPRASLNPFIVLAAVAAWERFCYDLVGATIDKDATPGSFDQWNDKDGRSNRPNLAWPGSSVREPPVSSRLHEAGALRSPLAQAWILKVPTNWRGIRPTGWRLAEYASAGNASSVEGQRTDRLILEAIAGAKTARDAVGHFLFANKARQAEAAEVYTWYADNHERGGAPTIQNGYARGVAALFVQLIDCSVAAVAAQQAWTTAERLPGEWFDAEPSQGRYAGVELWGGAALHRVG